MIKRRFSSVRETFLRFFQHQQDHHCVESARLVPSGLDQSLLFTNAGMAPFKPYFLGEEKPKYARVTSAQRCLRAGGKHNDLDAVGFTRRHHTLFEMLGNFSFGSYFKEEAIYMAWQFLTKELQLPVDRLHVTVYQTDEEAANLWKQIANLPEEKIRRLGAEDNFWSMGETGPCGPCSEIFWDLGEEYLDEDERYLELWNLVFMQHDRKKISHNEFVLDDLPNLCVDTGMGLERITSVLENVPSNYDITTMRYIMEGVAQAIDKQNPTSQSKLHRLLKDPPLASSFVLSDEMCALRVIADHMRAACFLIADDVFPSNIGREYVLRRILRRAIRYGQKLGVQEPFMKDIVPFVIHACKSAHPLFNDVEKQMLLQEIINNEEINFLKTLEKGLNELEQFLTLSNSKTLSAEHAFKLYDTFGFPVDLTEIVAKEKGMDIDLNGFDNLMEAQKRKSREASSIFTTPSTAKSSCISVGSEEFKESLFTGYSKLVQKSKIISVEADSSPDRCWLGLDPSPFYPEGGGQVGDIGTLIFDREKKLNVLNTIRARNGRIVVQVDSSFAFINEAFFKNGFASFDVVAKVDRAHRIGCNTHHTATHLLNTALRKTLGVHISQKGSLVTKDYLRFDFNHFSPVTTAQLDEIQDSINSFALNELPITSENMEYTQAIDSGAVCLSNEQYNDQVRVINVGDVSSELCGGTHVDCSSDIYPFIITREGSAASGIRRIEAVAGRGAVKYLQERDSLLQRVSMECSSTPDMLLEKVIKMGKNLKESEEDLKSYYTFLSALPSNPCFSGNILDASLLQKSAQLQFHVHTLNVRNKTSDKKKEKNIKNLLRTRAQFLLQQQPNDVHFVVLNGDRVICVANQYHAGNCLRFFLSVFEGHGGGGKNTAEGKLPNPIDSDNIITSLSKNSLIKQ